MMPTKFLIPRILHKYLGDQDSLTLRGNTLADLFVDLKSTHPALYQCVFTETGQLRRHLHLFINNDRVEEGQWDYLLKPNDVVSVFQAVSGG